MADLLRILIADNDEMIRETLKRIIRYKVRMACEIFEADTGYNAQETAYKCYPHMFITDVRMPDITAAELIKKFENKSVRFILMSGYRDFPLARGNKTRCFRLPFKTFARRGCCKPGNRNF